MLCCQGFYLILWWVSRISSLPRDTLGVGHAAWPDPFIDWTFFFLQYLFGTSLFCGGKRFLQAFCQWCRFLKALEFIAFSAENLVGLNRKSIICQPCLRSMFSFHLRSGVGTGLECHLCLSLVTGDLRVQASSATVDRNTPEAPALSQCVNLDREINAVASQMKAASKLGMQV